ncbi:hypothetical protein [Pseudomonas chlororaphis]|uniref:hypothetical protein n=1 Tax=Pseudomonas chlororaphis TaxID=587753 RepID=UPI0023652529|nr:hypothetical protein [Pseudomonas chlororaphis]WDH24076.1 hypothetical protein PUP50_07260 [Pseudomonas chlororaphis]
MSQTIGYLLASLHRAQHQGDKTLNVSTLDLKEVLAELQSIKTREEMKCSGGALVGWADPVKVREMREGKRFYLTVRRKKSEHFSKQVCASAAQLADPTLTDIPADAGGYQ